MASILIIDDDSAYASMTQQRLERAGHLVSLHIGPFGATKAASQLGIDLILLDVFMPGLSGPQLLEVMRQNKAVSHAKVVLCSSMDPAPLKALAEEHRADGYVPKSADRQELLSVVERVLSAGRFDVTWRQLLCAVAALLSLWACKSSKREPEKAAPVTRASASASAKAEPLKIAYSDWPGWVAWDIAVEKGYFKAAGVDVSLVWLEYVPTMESFSEGKVDAVCMTNGDALVSGSSGAKSVGIVINDYSNGNDMIVVQPSIKKLSELKGKKVGVEVGFVDHLLLMEALKSVGLAEGDVDIVNTKTQDTPALLKSGGASAIAAWQPNSGHALDQVPGSSALFTSANVPGLIYDVLFVSPKSLQARRGDWKKVVTVWFQVVAFINDPAHRAEAARIMSQKAQMTPERYEKLMNGTQFLDLAENRKRFEKRPGFETVYGSSEIVDQFNVANRVYREKVAADPYFDPSLVAEVASGQ